MQLRNTLLHTRYPTVTLASKIEAAMWPSKRLVAKQVRVDWLPLSGHGSPEFVAPRYSASGTLPTVFVRLHSLAYLLDQSQTKRPQRAELRVLQVGVQSNGPECGRKRCG